MTNSILQAKVKVIGLKVILPKDNDVAYFNNSTPTIELIYNSCKMVYVMLLGICMPYTSARKMVMLTTLEFKATQSTY